MAINSFINYLIHSFIQQGYGGGQEERGRKRSREERRGSKWRREAASDSHGRRSIKALLL
jgi:hypothetical protein